MTPSTEISLKVKPHHIKDKLEAYVDPSVLETLNINEGDIAIITNKDKAITLKVAKADESECGTLVIKIPDFLLHYLEANEGDNVQVRFLKEKDVPCLEKCILLVDANKKVDERWKLSLKWMLEGKPIHEGMPVKIKEYEIIVAETHPAFGIICKETEFDVKPQFCWEIERLLEKLPKCEIKEHSLPYAKIDVTEYEAYKLLGRVIRHVICADRKFDSNTEKPIIKLLMHNGILYEVFIDVT